MSQFAGPMLVTASARGQSRTLVSSAIVMEATSAGKRIHREVLLVAFRLMARMRSACTIPIQGTSVGLTVGSTLTGANSLSREKTTSVSFTRILTRPVVQ
jgi:hypothetical protein